MIPLQILCILFSLGAIYFTYVHFRRKDFAAFDFVFWVLIWLGLIVVSVVPSTISAYVQKLGFFRLMDFVVVVAFIVAFSLLIHCYLVAHKTSKNVEKLSREISLKSFKSKKDK
tara:strand:+ start:838 stop:1179 length:342 start_codon:yes stop_codon:yes gene_type:complete